MSRSIVRAFLLVLGIACSSQQPRPPIEYAEKLPQAPVAHEGFLTTADAVRLHYRVAGAGRDTIVVVHGGPGGSWEEIVAGFVPLTEHHVVIFYDQRGGGRSSRPADATHLTAAYQVEDLDDIRRRFGLETMQLVGHSYGAVLAATYAIARPSAVASLIILAGIGPRTVALGPVHSFAVTP